MTPKEMGLRLRTMFIGRGDENFLQYQARIAQEACELANILDPTGPKFKVGDWVWGANKAVYRVLRPYENDSPNKAWWVDSFIALGEKWLHERHMIPLGFDPLEYAKLIHEGKPLPGYISLKDLPELEEGWEYDRIGYGGTDEYYVDEDGKICVMDDVTKLRLIIRRKGEK